MGLGDFKAQTNLILLCQTHFEDGMTVPFHTFRVICQLFSKCNLLTNE